MLRENEEKKKMKIEMFYALRRNSKWIIISSTQHEKRGFYDSIHEFCVLSSPANLKFHTDHKNIEKKAKRCVCEFYVSNITIGFGINCYGKFCSYCIIRFRVYP